MRMATMLKATPLIATNAFIEMQLTFARSRIAELGFALSRARVLVGDGTCHNGSGSKGRCCC